MRRNKQYGTTDTFTFTGAMTKLQEIFMGPQGSRTVTLQLYPFLFLNDKPPSKTLPEPIPKTPGHDLKGARSATRTAHEQGSFYRALSSTCGLQVWLWLMIL